ncbi:MAG: serine/threonine-protein phosphatase [Phycisphaerales bacterium]|nr:serine/threonine-protein phosphatase [Phycisphaerales bacterium]
MNDSFIDVDFAQRSKHTQHVSGDVFVTRKIKEETRTLSVLSDGLGSGVKASVLANMTAAMAIKYTSAFVDVRKSAKTIMDTLPICEVRKISYSTFTIADLDDDDGTARFIEHGNPPLVLFRGPEELPLEKASIQLAEWKDRVISYAETQLQLGDRVLFFSDGISQSGMEQRNMPMGWGRAAAKAYASEAIRQTPDIASRQLAAMLVDRAHTNDLRKAKDDITCGVIYYRRPRRLLVISGPPFSKERDAELATLVQTYAGKKAICGGTTATIVSRLLQREVHMNIMDMEQFDPEVPPTSSMEGVDLITEGTLTLAKIAEMLERHVRPAPPRLNAAARLVQLMQASDVVDFVVGTRINDAHQDPNLPVELDLRRNIIRKIANLLEKIYLKNTSIQFL